MGDVAMALPTETFEGLRAGHQHDVYRLRMTTQAIFLNDGFGSFFGPNRDRCLSSAKNVYIVKTLPSFFEVMGDRVVVGQVTI